MRTEGLWLKCENCRQILWKKDLEASLNVCTHCGTQAVAIVTIQLDEDQLPQADARELTPLDDTASQREPVSADDVLEIHALLDGFEGDVARLLDRLDRGTATESR